MSYQYDPKQYQSPQRVWDAAKGEHLDLWVYGHTFDLWLPDGRHIQIEAGFEYDKGSVPPWIRNWLPRDDSQSIIAFLIHDWLYEKQQIQGKWITRKEADQILYGLLRHAGMRWTKAKAAYLGVRAGGWTTFNARAKKLGNIHYL